MQFPGCNEVLSQLSPQRHCQAFVRDVKTFLTCTPKQLQHFSYKLKQLDIAINKTTRIQVVPVFDPDNECYGSQDFS